MIEGYGGGGGGEQTRYRYSYLDQVGRWEKEFDHERRKCSGEREKKKTGQITVVRGVGDNRVACMKRTV